ncbi:MAG: hypothetical protein M3R05_07380 [Chloroflexota bacterium]|nr:hypothetical protein [Chloroflexota bacterium]
MNLFPVLLVAHVSLAIALLLPSVVLPFILRGGREPGAVAEWLVVAQGNGTLLIGLGLAVTGAAMLAILGPSLLRQPWLLVALLLYAINLLVAGFISRPNLRRLIGIGASDAATWRRRARQQRYVAYGMAAVIGVIGFLMSTKPQLW